MADIFHNYFLLHSAGIVLSNYKKEKIKYSLHYILGKWPGALLIRGFCKNPLPRTLDQMPIAVSRSGFSLPLLHWVLLVIELPSFYKSYFLIHSHKTLPYFHDSFSLKKLIFFANTALRIHFSHSPTVGTKHEAFIAVNNYHWNEITI